MSVSVNGPKTPITKGSNGIAMATLPNICKMPGPPAPFVPVPLPNIGKSGDKPKGYSKKVKIEKKNVAIRGASFGSLGDIASKGTGGGLISANTHGPCKFISPGSLDVKFEGKNVQLLTDMVTNNGAGSGMPANAATMMGIFQLSGLLIVVDTIDRCILCEKKHEKLSESFTNKSRAKDLSIAYHQKVVDDMIEGQEDIRNKTMLGVLKCKCAKNEYAANSGKTCSQLVEAAEKEGMNHLNVSDHYSKKKIKKFMNDRYGEKRTNIIFRRIKRERKEEISFDRNYYHEIGMCAAPSLILLCYDNNGYPNEITERYYSHEWPMPNMTRKDRNRTINQYRYKEIKRDKSGRRTVNIVKKDFKSGDSVPPCGTCEILLPVLMCPEPGEEKCIH